MKEIFELINEMSPYLLLGFLLAGIMHVFVPSTLYSRYLSAGNFRSVFYSAMFGIPLPLCSCGVIPTAMSLHREGASKGATVSFLIATPQTGVDSIIATYSLMGLPFAIVRPIAALLTALLGGCLVNKLETDDKENGRSESKAGEVAKASSLSEEFKDIIRRGWWTNIKAVVRYAYVDMMQDIGKSLIIGLVVAGIITTVVPDSFFTIFQGNTLLSIALVLVFAIPMYLCATGSIPIAVAFMLKGLSPGAAIVLLMAGPAVNVASILVVGKVLGRKTMLLYLLSIIGGATLCALAIDYLLPQEWFTEPLKMLHTCCHEGSPIFNIGATVVLFLLLVNAFIMRYRKGHEACTCHTKEVTATTYHVKGMSCNHCKANVERVIGQLEGVEEVSVDLASSTATVKGSVTEHEVRKAVESIGFKCE